ncbi:MAG: hypothetical protein J5676_07075 [Bacteroidaceae bacterium]|nr:hypothetical protein [Bacteroidaceae bacterium]
MNRLVINILTIVFLLGISPKMYSQQFDKISYDNGFQKKLRLSTKTVFDNNGEMPFFMFGIGEEFIVVSKTKSNNKYIKYKFQRQNLDEYTCSQDTIVGIEIEQIFKNPITFNHKETQKCKCQQHYDTNYMYFYITNDYGEMYGENMPVGVTNPTKHRHINWDAKTFGYVLDLYLTTFDLK